MVGRGQGKLKPSALNHENRVFVFARSCRIDEVLIGNEIQQDSFSPHRCSYRYCTYQANY